MRSGTSRLIGWAIPLVCMAIAFYIVMGQYAGLRKANDHLVSAQRHESEATDTKEKAERASGKLHVAAAPASDREESEFLKGLHMRADTAGIRIAKWTSRGLDMPPKPTDGSADKTENPATQGILKYSGTLSLVGSYQGIRAFLAALGQSSRLFTFSEMHWARKEGDRAGGTLQVDTTISRYVDPAVAKPATTPSTLTPEKKT
jgi:hypothetical protein